MYVLCNKIPRFCRIPRFFFNFPKPRLNRLQMPILLSRLLFGIGKRFSFKPKFKRKGIDNKHLNYQNQQEPKVHEFSIIDQSHKDRKEMDFYGSPMSPMITILNDTPAGESSTFVPVYTPHDDGENEKFNRNSSSIFESIEDDHNNENLEFKPSQTDLNLIQAFNDLSEKEQPFAEKVKTNSEESIDTGPLYEYCIKKFHKCTLLMYVIKARLLFL